MTHKASGCEEQTLVGMDGAEPNTYASERSIGWDHLAKSATAACGFDSHHLQFLHKNT